MKSELNETESELFILTKRIAEQILLFDTDLRNEIRRIEKVGEPINELHHVKQWFDRYVDDLEHLRTLFDDI